MSAPPVKVDPRPGSGGDALYPVVGADGVARYADGTRWEPSATFPGKGRWVPDGETTSGEPQGLSDPWPLLRVIAGVGLLWVLLRDVKRGYL